MKIPVRNLLLLDYAATAYAAAAPGSGDARVAAICEGLGVLSFEDGRLPDGVSPGDVRMCAGHLNGKVRGSDPQQGASLAPIEVVEGVVLSADETTAPPPPVGPRACRESLLLQDALWLFW
ncbi:hypothetical protein CGRA01v4_12176 [Colletotrichum graminicola]|nr:hypothetical protein CGRA01v4_12176 [Colletotrichum graminicola]